MALKIDVREAVLDATEQQLGRFGYRKMTIEDIARAAGIGKGTVYLHFASKEDVALSAIDRIVDRVVARLEEVANEGTTAAVRLREMLISRVLVRFDAVRHYSESLNDMLAVIRPALLERRKTWFRREERVFARVLAQGHEKGELEVDHAARVARDLLAATGIFLPYSLTPNELGRRTELATRVGRVADLLLSGLLAR